MILKFLRQSILFTAVAAFVGLAVGRHALHETTCDHGHLNYSLTAAEPEAKGCRSHCHHHAHGAEGEHKHAHQPAGQEHQHPDQHRHSHHGDDCLICQFTALNTAIIADATEVTEADAQGTAERTAQHCDPVTNRFSGPPRAPPA